MPNWNLSDIPESQRQKVMRQQVKPEPASKPAQPRARGRRHEPGTMNSTETAYAAILEARKRAGEIYDYRFEAITFRLAKLCSYRVDFFVFTNDMVMELHEVKAGNKKTGKALIEDDAAVKLRLMAELYPMFPLILAVKIGNEWKMEGR